MEMTSFEDILGAVYPNGIPRSQYAQLPRVIGKIHDLVVLAAPPNETKETKDPPKKKKQATKTQTPSEKELISKIMEMHDTGMSNLKISETLRSEGIKISHPTVGKRIKTEELRRLAKENGATKAVEPQAPNRGRIVHSDDDISGSHKIERDGLDFSDVSEAEEYDG
jgi:IS30 family transposase